MAILKAPARQRIGRVSLYWHHGRWWFYYRSASGPVRRPAGNDQTRAECEASLLNARLAATETGLDLTPLLRELSPALSAPAAAPNQHGTISVFEMRRRFLDHHEKVMGSAVGTVSRYATATAHLDAFASKHAIHDALTVSVSLFIEYLRAIEVAPNGHPHTAKRKLRDNGIRYILETCRAMYHHAQRLNLIPRHLANPFSEFGLGKLRIRDAKPVYVFTPQAEVAFLSAAGSRSFAVHFTLAKTGARSGELVHLLIEDLDLENGWLWIRGKPELGWSVKTSRERRVPLVSELVSLLRLVIGSRSAGPAFLRPQASCRTTPLMMSDRLALAKIARQRLERAQADRGSPLSRREEARIHAKVWQDAGAINCDRIRCSFIRAAVRAGLSGATCPKSWRHTFATLLQEANVDLLVRQETLGHKPSCPELSALGMTGVYTHTSSEVHRKEIERALRLRPLSLQLAVTFVHRSQGEGAQH